MKIIDLDPIDKREILLRQLERQASFSKRTEVDYFPLKDPETGKEITIESPPLPKYSPPKRDWSRVNLIAVFNKIVP